MYHYVVLLSWDSTGIGSAYNCQNICWKQYYFQYRHSLGSSAYLHSVQGEFSDKGPEAEMPGQSLTKTSTRGWHQCHAKYIQIITNILEGIGKKRRWVSNKDNNKGMTKASKSTKASTKHKDTGNWHQCIPGKDVNEYVIQKIDNATSNQGTHFTESSSCLVSIQAQILPNCLQIGKGEFRRSSS